MVEKILEKIVNETVVHLNQGQLEHLSNVLYVNFHSPEVQASCSELVSATKLFLTLRGPFITKQKIL